MIDHPQVQASRPWWALVVAILLFVVAVGLVAAAAEPGHADPSATDETPAMLTVAPGGTVELASLPAEHPTAAGNVTRPAVPCVWRKPATFHETLVEQGIDMEAGGADCPMITDGSMASLHGNAGLHPAGHHGPPTE